jgi:hypothetical protein
MTTAPICPCCNTALVPRVFAGYYDRFTCWTCACTDANTLIPGATILAGGYGWGTDGDLATVDDLGV